MRPGLPMAAMAGPRGVDRQVALVIEAFHAVDDEAAERTFEGQITPGSTGVIHMGNAGFVVMLESLARDNHNEGRSRLGPTLVELDQQVEKQGPILRFAPGVKETPRLIVKT